jgi:hypothetical protein
MATWQASWRSSLAAAALATLFGTAAADDTRETAEEIEQSIAAELELVNEQAAGIVEDLQAELELVLDVEPQLALLLASEDEEEEVEFEEEEEEEEEDEAEEEDEDEGDEEEDEAEDEGDGEGADAQRELRRAIIQLRQSAGAEAQARQAKLAEQMARLHAELDGAKVRIAKDNEKVAKQLKVLMQRAHEAAAQGNHEAAKALAEHMRHIQKLGGHADVHFALAGEIPEAQRRIHHLTQAAENLRAIGKVDLAEELMHEAKAAKEEFARMHEHAGHPGSENEKLAIELKLHGEEAAAHEGSVHQLREEMNELRGQVEEMRAMLERVAERLDGGSGGDEE